MRWPGMHRPSPPRAGVAQSVLIPTDAADVRGDVLEMLDAELTTSYGRDRVRRSDILDIDPGNHRATVTWSAANGEGSPITGYVITAIPGGIKANAGPGATRAGS